LAKIEKYTVKNYPDPSDFRFHTTFRVRLYFCDSYGIIHHTNYLRYLEDTRVEYLRAIGLDYEKLEDVGKIFLVVDTYCKHLGVARLDDEIIVYCRAIDFSRTTLQLEYIITRKGESGLIFYGWVTLVCVDSKTRKPIRVPEQIVNGMTTYDGGKVSAKYSGAHKSENR